MQITTKNQNGDVVYSQLVPDETMSKITSMLMTTPKIPTEGLNTTVECLGNNLGFTNQELDLTTMIKVANGIPVRKAKGA